MSYFTSSFMTCTDKTLFQPLSGLHLLPYLWSYLKGILHKKDIWACRICKTDTYGCYFPSKEACLIHLRKILFHLQARVLTKLLCKGILPILKMLFWLFITVHFFHKNVKSCSCHQVTIQSRGLPTHSRSLSVMVAFSFVCLRRQKPYHCNL